jgi:hypothetical protein
MGRTRIHIVLLLAFPLFLFSCAARKAAEEIAVITPPNFTGKIQLDACVPGAPATNVSISENGEGQTSVCSVSKDLKLVIVRGGQAVAKIPAQIVKTGDDIVVRISASL